MRLNIFFGGRRMDISINFFGKPSLQINKIDVKMEQKKTLALLIYILFNNKCTREELSELFWCDTPQEIARRNLRNCLYSIKKNFPDDLIISSGHSFITLSPDVKVSRDVDLFITENSTEELLELPSCVFLEHFNIKSSPEFENWVLTMRSVYEKMFITRFEKEMEISIKNNLVQQIEICALRILKIDPYHEKACRQIMQIYSFRKDYNTALLCYKTLSKNLSEDLGIEPEEETQGMFKKILQLKKAIKSINFTEINKADTEIITAIKEEYHSFHTGKPFRHIMINGDYGMGKSEILKEFMGEVPKSEIVQLDFQIYSRPIDYYGVEILIDVLSAWMGLNKGLISSKHFSELSQNSHSHLFRILVDYLNKNMKKCVLVLKNLEAIDTKSANLLLTYLFATLSKNLFIVCEYCPNFSVDYSFLKKIKNFSHVKNILIEPMNYSNSAYFIRENLNNLHCNDEVFIKGYHYTNGNLLLLREFVDNVKRSADLTTFSSEKCTEIMDKLALSLSSDEYEALELLAVLKEIEVSTMVCVLDLSPIIAVRIIESLVHKGLVYEIEKNNRILIVGKFHLIQNLIFEKMAKFKQLEFYRLAAEYYEDRYLLHGRDFFSLTKASEYYSYTNNYKKKIHYNLLHFEFVLDYFDEFFPTITNDLQQLQETAFLRKDISSRFAKYYSDLSLAENDLPSSEFHLLKMKLNFLFGRFMIRSEEKNIGSNYIQNVINLARRSENNEMLMKAYLETICFSIRSEDTALFNEYIAKAEQINELGKFEKEGAILLRFKGYFSILNKEYFKAMEYLWESIKILENPNLESSNACNIAGAYEYLSFCSRKLNKLDDALQYINKSIVLCEKNNVKKCLDVLYSECGYVLLLKEDYVKAEKYFIKSVSLYEHFDTYWFRSVSESGLAVIYAHWDKTSLSLEHFRRAELYARKGNAKEEISILEDTRKLLKTKGVL